MRRRILDRATIDRLAEIAKVPSERRRNFPVQFALLYNWDTYAEQRFEEIVKKLSDDQLIAIGRVERAAEKLVKELDKLEPETRAVIRENVKGGLSNLQKVIRESSEVMPLDWQLALNRRRLRLSLSDDFECSPEEDECPPEPDPRSKRARGRPRTRLGRDNLSKADRFVCSLLRLVANYGGQLTLSDDTGTLLEFMDVLGPCLPGDWRLPPGRLRYLRELVSTEQKRN
jgi:hypothetical protein